MAYSTQSKDFIYADQKLVYFFLNALLFIKPLVMMIIPLSDFFELYVVLFV